MNPPPKGKNLTDGVPVGESPAVVYPASEVDSVAVRANTAMGRGHFVVAIAVSTAVAFLFLFLAAFGSTKYPEDLGGGAKGLLIQLPLFAGASLGFDRTGALILAFIWYFAIAFGCVAWYMLRRELDSGNSKR